MNSMPPLDDLVDRFVVGDPCGAAAGDRPALREPAPRSPSCEARDLLAGAARLADEAGRVGRDAEHELLRIPPRR